MGAPEKGGSRQVPRLPSLKPVVPKVGGTTPLGAVRNSRDR